MRFSIIIPAFDVAPWIGRCVASALAQDGAFEVIVIDDRSRDGTYEAALALADSDARVRVLRTPVNGGPGAARNVGLDAARGKWILFLDADDTLAPDALAALSEHIDAEPDRDLIGYNWCFENGTGGRRDQQSLAKPKADLIRDALALKTDGSVIFTAMRAAMLRAHGLRFAEGLHEDVDFIFEAYCAAERVAWLDRVLYVKQERPGSIVQTMSARHVDGFVRAFAAIGETFRRRHAARLGLSWPDFASACLQGWIGVIATRVRALRLLQTPAAEAAAILTHLATLLRAQGVDITRASLPVRTTKYYALAERFCRMAAEDDAFSVAHVAALFALVDDIALKSYSCVDLHHSAFLRADQVRTCCKRFFVDGEMRGDVVLLDARGEDKASFDASAILEAKRALHAGINRGEETACTGCPFLELKPWSNLETLEIKYLSLEHHSVCNLKCSYCSEEYYGGERSRYDVIGLVNQLGREGALTDCTGIVWGGGEPTIDAAFVPLVRALEQSAPNVKQRVLTNAVARSETLEDLLRRDRAVAVTSVDAGTAATFTAVRGKDRLRRVMDNLARMAEARAENVTVKYIFTDGNATAEEALAFADLTATHDLLGCNFQLSSDFKKEDVPRAALTAMAVLHGALTQAGARIVFVDDLVRQRFTALNEEARADLASKLSALGYGGALADPSAYSRVAIWGAGWQAKFLLERARFFETVDAAFFVDATPTKIGGRYLDRDVCAPNVLTQDDAPIVIAAAQAYPAIYQSFLDLGLDKARLVRGLIL